MRFKALKHKTELGIWGVFMQGQVFSDKAPCLLSQETTMESLKEIMVGSQMASALEQVKEYELIEVQFIESKELAILNSRAATLSMLDERIRECYDQIKEWQLACQSSMEHAVYRVVLKKMEDLIPTLKIPDAIRAELPPACTEKQAKEHAWKVFDHSSTIFHIGDKRAYFDELWDKYNGDDDPDDIRA